MEKGDILTLASLLAKWTFAERLALWGEQGEGCYDRLCLLHGQANKTTSRWDRFTKGYAQTEPAHDCPPPAVPKPSRNPQETPKLAFAMQLHLKRSHVLANLTLLGVHMTQDSWKLLGDGLTHASALATIILVDCGLTDLYMCGLVRGLSELKELKRLDLSGNEMETGYEVGRIIENHGEKRDEAVWARGLRNESMDEEPKGLQEVVLCSNQLNDQSIEVLSHVLSTDIWLKAIDLSRNKLTEAGISLLAEVLKRNKALIYVDVRDNGLETNHNLLRMVYNSLRRNYLKYEKGNEDAGEWKQKLLSMLSCIEPGLLPPQPHTPSPARPSHPSISPSPLTDRYSSPLLSKRKKPCTSCHLLSNQVSNLTKEVRRLKVENERLGSLVRTWEKQRGGEVKEGDSVTMSRIEQMMTEVSRMMETLERKE